MQTIVFYENKCKILYYDLKNYEVKKEVVKKKLQVYIAEKYIDCERGRERKIKIENMARET